MNLQTSGPKYILRPDLFFPLRPKILSSPPLEKGKFVKFNKTVYKKSLTWVLFFHAWLLNTCNLWTIEGHGDEFLTALPFCSSQMSFVWFGTRYHLVNLEKTQMSWARDGRVETEPTHIAHPFFLMRYFKNRAKNTSQGKAVTVSMVPLNEKNFKVFAPACLLHPMLWKTFSYCHFPPCRLHSINLLSLHALTEPAPPFGPSSLAFLPAVFFTLFFL